jgi:hypothetical protein
MSSAILDVQCILGENNKYFIKEMSIVDTETCSTQHWIFKHLNNIQDEKSISVNKWLQHHYHRLSLECGDVEYKELCKILNSFKFNSIYVKGDQKRKIIKEYLPHVNVVNLENLGCPRLNEVCDEETQPCCISHKDSSPNQCTFFKVFALKKWFINNY